MADDRRAFDVTDPTALPLDELCGAILDRHHAYAYVAVPRIRGHLAMLAEREPQAVPAGVQEAFTALADRLMNHLAKEEHILFPALALLADAERSGAGRPPMPFPTVLHPIRLMESEHASLASALDQLSTLAGGFGITSDASDAVRRLMTELAAFRDHLESHLRIENDVLFPRALELDRRL
jgi:regulator of cell morphogenesis and NO signaling